MSDRLIALGLLAASLSFALGITLPVVEVERLFVFSDTPSLAGIVTGLWASGDIGLAVVIGLFSIILPATKLSVLHLALVHTARTGTDAGPRMVLPRWLHALANWSMLDVVLVALVVFAAKTSGLASAAARPGLWFFALSAVLTAVLAKTVDRRRSTDTDADTAG